MKVSQNGKMSPENALIRLESMCARAEHCTYEIQEKLRKWGISQDQSTRIIDSLVKNKYVDDKRFARAYTRDKFMFAHWGRRKIILQLRLRRIPADVITDSIAAAIDEQEYYNVLVDMLRRNGAIAIKDSEGNPTTRIHTFDGRTRMYRHALSRGFESELISRAIHTLYSRLK